MVAVRVSVREQANERVGWKGVMTLPSRSVYIAPKWQQDYATWHTKRIRMSGGNQ